MGKLILVMGVFARRRDAKTWGFWGQCGLCPAAVADAPQHMWLMLQAFEFKSFQHSTQGTIRASKESLALTCPNTLCVRSTVHLLPGAIST